MKLEKIEITTNQIISLNQAINILSNSNSDHAEQCLFYLKQLQETARKAKIIHQAKEGK